MITFLKSMTPNSKVLKTQVTTCESEGTSLIYSKSRITK